MHVHMSPEPALIIMITIPYFSTIVTTTTQQL